MSLTAGKQLLLSSPAGGYQVSRSLRFNSADSAYLNRTPGSASNRTTWTWSGWLKRSGLSNQYTFFDGYSDGSNRTQLMLESDNTLRILNLVGGSATTNLITTAVFRDASAWYHIVITWDTTQGTSSNRVKLYVNGTQQTSFSTSTYPGLSENSFINAVNAHDIGRTGAFTEAYYSGYLAEINFIDGQALDPTSFATTDATTGQWIPKTYTGSYGTNGFKLTFSDNSNNTATTLGKDTSGNGNNWTPVNLIAVPAARQGYKGGDSYQYSAGNAGGGGGGGAGAPGSNGVSGVSAGAGGAGRQSSITGSAVYYGGGGGGGSWGTAGGAGGLGGGGAGKLGGSSTGPANPGTNGLGGGGGGAGYASADWQAGGAGGSGRVIIRYPTSYGTLTSSAGGSLTTVGSDYVYQWTSVGTGSITFPGSSTIPVQYLVLGGGGGAESGGGGGGGMLDGTINISGGSSQTITVGAGGAGASPYPSVAPAANGGNSVFASITALGGGRGAGGDSGAAATSGGSGGGGGSTTGITTGGAGTGDNQSDIDSLVDTPTSYGTDTGAGGEVRGNYCTFNPLFALASLTLTNGNLETSSPGAAWRNAKGTFAMTTGKWYWEHTVPTTGAADGYIGGVATATADYSSSSTGIWGRQGTTKYSNGSSSTPFGSTTAGDILGFAFDADAGKLWVAQNGTWVGDPGAGTGESWSGIPSGVFPYVAAYNQANVVNFGQRAFAYTNNRSGFKALCDTNLTAPVVAKPNTVMDVKLYTGNGSTQTVSGLGFSPDLVWLKSRSSGSYSHNIYDAVRGATKIIYSDSTSAENTDANGLTAFNSDGFSLGSTAATNASSTTYVGWIWDAGSSAAAPNNSGSITSTVKVNATAGFSIVSYTGTGTSPVSVGHGLNVAPTFLIFKDRDTAVNWQVWTTAVNSSGTVLEGLNTTAAGTTPWTYISTTSSLIQFNSGNSAQTSNGKKFICYAWAPVTGYSSFGSYTGNGSADGPFVYTGFRPRWILMKQSVAGEAWTMYDTARDTYNVAGLTLFANYSNAETDYKSYTPLDILSNGFKLRTSNITWNTNGATVIYAAFAESPFQYARAR